MITNTVLLRSIVTPYVGVWIEIANAGNDYGIVSVTPYVGVWIEIDLSRITKKWVEGHPLCGGVD